MISLGINYSNIHDSSACIAKDGEIVFAAAEERFSRTKHDARFPALAIKACFDYTGTRAEDLDFICYGWPLPPGMFLHDLGCLLRRKEPLCDVINSFGYAMAMWRQRGGEKDFRSAFGPTKARALHISHHLAHAISAYAFSGFDEAAVLVVDGQGTWESTSLWKGRGGRLEHLWTIPWPNSLGLFYGQFTAYLGFQFLGEEWKVMGLAPYGHTGVNLDEFLVPNERPYCVAGKQLLGRNPLAAIEARFGPKRSPGSPLQDRHRNIAFAVQDYCEQAMLTLAHSAISQTGCRNLCLAGGVALNSKANGKILASGLLDRLFVQPAASDDGVCLGAALAPLHEGPGCLPVCKMRTTCLGPGYCDDDIEKILRDNKLRFTRSSDPARVAADLIADGKIIGWFQGRMEFGPRALGARSILADPRDPAMMEKVNNTVKFRESWRPLALSLLSARAADYIDCSGHLPFMTATVQVRSGRREVIPSVTHVDGSTRPQMVDSEANPLFWQLIVELERHTGVPVVMNTSFNLQGEPIVCTPSDAVHSFLGSGMDAMVIGSFVLERKCATQHS